jgi:hypothetical protein
VANDAAAYANENMAATKISECGGGENLAAGGYQWRSQQNAQRGVSAGVIWQRSMAA